MRHESRPFFLKCRQNRTEICTLRHYCRLHLFYASSKCTPLLNLRPLIFGLSCLIGCSVLRWPLLIPLFLSCILFFIYVTSIYSYFFRNNTRAKNRGLEYSYSLYESLECLNNAPISTFIGSKNYVIYTIGFGGEFWGCHSSGDRRTDVQVFCLVRLCLTRNNYRSFDGAMPPFPGSCNQRRANLLGLRSSYRSVIIY